jgi:hypothetical protein
MLDVASKRARGSLEDKPDAWVEICRSFAPADAEQYALVLAAAGIDCRLVALDGAVTLSVAPGQQSRLW